MKGLTQSEFYLLDLVTPHGQTDTEVVATDEQVRVLDGFVARGLCVLVEQNAQDKAEGYEGTYKRTPLGDLALRLHTADSMIKRVG